MNDETYNSYVEKLNSLCKSSIFDDVSPTDGSGLEKSESVPFFISEDMNIEEISKDNLYLMHTMLHTFYGRKGSKNLDMKTIEKLHAAVKEMINHSRFDSLDDK